MTDFRDDEYRDVEVQRDENGMIIMPSERPTEPPPKTGGMAGIIFVAVLAVAGIGGYFVIQNAPPAQEYALEQSDASEVYTAPETQQFALTETPAEATPYAPAPVQRQAAPPTATVDPIAPPAPMDLNTEPAGE